MKALYFKEKIKKTSNRKCINSMLSIFLLFLCITTYAQNNIIKDVIIIDATQDVDNFEEFQFDDQLNQWTIHPNENDIFEFKVLKEVSFQDIVSNHKVIPIQSFIDDSSDKYELVYGKRPEPPYFAGTHIETMIYRNLYLKVTNLEKEKYYKVTIKYFWKIDN